MAGVPGHESAGQRRGHDARGVGGARWGAIGTATSQRDCGSRNFDGHPGGCVSFAFGKAGRRRCAVHPDSGTERDDRATPWTLGFFTRRIPGAAAVLGGLEADLGDRSAGCRPGAATAATAHRWSLARPNGDARARGCVAATLGWSAVLV